MAHRILFGQAAREKILKGISIMAEAVGCTMGPDGRTMLIDKGRNNRPVAVKDGVTVARHVRLEDPEEALGAQVLYEASDLTNKEAGDATTCAVVLGAAMVQEGMKHSIAGRNVNQMRTGMLRAAKAVKEQLQKLSSEIQTDEEIRNVAIISCQDNVIGGTIADVMAEIDPESTVTTEVVQGSPRIEWYLEKGMHIDNGFESPLLCTDLKKMEWNKQDVLVLVSDDPILRQEQLLPMLQFAIDKGKRDFLIVAPRIEGSFPGSPLQLLYTNKIKGKMNAMFVKAPEFGQRQKDIIKDIAVYTGAFLYSSELGCPLPEGLGYYKDKEQGVVHADIALENFGVSPRVIVTQQKTTIVSKENRSKDIEGYLDELRGAIDAEKNSFEEEFKRKRLGMLTSGVGVIRVAAPSELESEDLRLRVDDALSAVKSAIQEGVLPGGGVALLRAVQGISDLRGATDDEQVGIEIVKYAIQRPAWQIATVSGMRGDAVIEKILDAKHKNYGCDVSKKIWGDMMKMGILDPTKAIRCALENSVSVAATFLTTHGTITDIPEVIRPQQ